MCFYLQSKDIHIKDPTFTSNHRSLPTWPLISIFSSIKFAQIQKMTSSARIMKADDETVDGIDAVSICVISESGSDTKARGSKDLNKSYKQGPRSFGDSISQRESFTPQTFVGVAKWDYVGDLKESPYFQPANASKMPPIEVRREPQAELNHMPESPPVVNIVPSEKVAPALKPSPRENQAPVTKTVQLEKTPLTSKPTAVSTRTQDERAPSTSKPAAVSTRTQDEKAPSTLKPTAVSTRAQYENTLSTSRPAPVSTRTQVEKTPSISKPSAVIARTQDGKAPSTSKPAVVSSRIQDEKTQPTLKTTPVSTRIQDEKSANVSSAKPKTTAQPAQVKSEVAPNLNEKTVSPKDKPLKTIVFKKDIDLTASDFSIGEYSISYNEDEMVDSEGEELKYSSHDEDDTPITEFCKNKKNNTYSNIDQTKIAFLSSKHTKLTSTRFSPVTGTGTDSSGDSSSEECVLYQAKEVTQLLLPEHAESVAADAFLRMCKVNFVVDERINVEYMSPSGRGPLLRCGPVLVAEFEPIVSFIESIGIRLTKNLSDAQLGELQAYTSLVRNTLLPAELFVSWMHAGTRLEVTELYYSQFHPYPLNIVVNRRKQQAAWDLLKALDRPLTSLHDAYSAVERCLRSLNDRLGSANYFFGVIPTQLDALVYGHLLLLGTLPVPKGDCFLRTMLGNYPALVMLVERIDSLTERRSDLSFMKEGICEVKTRALIDSYIEARQISSLAALGNKTYDYLGGIRKHK